MLKKLLISVALLFTICALVPGSALAEGNGKHKSSPFLITGKLPHLTKMLMQQWDNPKLKLTDAQKEKLLVVRKDTISGAQQFGREIVPLEQQVVDGITAGQTAEELLTTVQSIAKLKTQATMLHLRCISRTSKILDPQQLAVLKKSGSK